MSKFCSITKFYVSFWVNLGKSLLFFAKRNLLVGLFVILLLILNTDRYH